MNRINYTVIMLSSFLLGAILSLFGISVLLFVLLLMFVVFLMKRIKWLSISTPTTIQIYSRLLVLLLMGYTLGGRGFAYIHIPGPIPIFLAEIVLIVGAIGAIQKPSILRNAISPNFFWILCFIIVGLLRLIPDIPKYGLDAIRDAAIWYYASFAVLMATIVSQQDEIYRLLSLYKWFALIVLIWIPFVVIFVYPYGNAVIPTFPGAPVPLIRPKPGDLSVHLAGVMIFMLFAKNFNVNIPLSGVWWILSVVDFAMLASINRGGAVAAMFAVLLALILKFKLKDLIKVGLYVILGILLFMFVFNRIAIQLERRGISTQQFITSIQSLPDIFMESNMSGPLGGTIRWRLLFWGRILREQLFGLNWVGVGFGPILADLYGVPRRYEGPPLRNAHNSTMTILARMGIIGLSVWIFLLIAFITSMLLVIKNRKAFIDIKWISIWVLSYWTAFLLNSVADPALEGPQGGVWFWTLFGLGIACIRLEKAKKV